MLVEFRAGHVELEVRAKQRGLHGLAAVFDCPTQIGSATELVRRGAFKDTLSDGHDILALFDHDPTRLLARTKSKTLQLREDDRGLVFDITLPDTAAGRDALVLAERGDLGGASFGFRVKDEAWIGKTRELRSVELVEVSIVSSFAACPSSEVHARARAPGAPVPPRLLLARRSLELLRLGR